MSGVPFIPLRQTPVNGSGRPYAGSTLNFYRAGTTTAQSVYANSSLGTSLGSTVTADSAGKFVAIYLDPNAGYDYRCIHKTSAGSTLSDDDNIPRTVSLTQAVVGAALHPLTANETAAALSGLDYAYRHTNIRRFVTSGAGTAASPFVIDNTDVQALIDKSQDMVFVFDPGYTYELAALTVTSTGRSTDSSLGTIYRAGIRFHAHGAAVKAASGVANLITFTDVSDCGIVGGYWYGSPTASFWKLNSTGTAIRGFICKPDRVKGGATSGTGTDAVGLLMDSSSGNIAGFAIGGEFGAHWTHLKDAIYMKNTAAGNGIDTGIIENIIGWPYGTAAAVGHTIRCESATDVVFRRIYGGLFEWDNAAAIYLNPTFNEGIKNCRFEIITADVSSAQTGCRTISALVNDSNKPIQGCTFDQIKMYKAATGTTGNNALYINTTNSGEFKNNLIAGVWSNDSAGDQAIVLGAYAHDNYIIPSGNIDTSALATWITDIGYRNKVLGHGDGMIKGSMSRSTVTAANATTAKTANIPGNSMAINEGIRISVNGQVATNANGVTIALKYGATVLATEVIAGTNTGLFRIEADVWNTGAFTTQRGFGRMWRGTTMVAHTQTTPAETSTADVAVTVVVTLNATPAGDTVHVDTLDVELLSAPQS